MSENRDYPRGVRAALISLSAGTCYWPACPEPVVRPVEGSFKIALEIAHIHALKTGGERYLPSMNDEERNSFENLILLCHLHHQTIDNPGGGEKYPAEQLKEWKLNREESGLQNVRGLRHLTEDRLQEILEHAVEDRDNDIKETLARLEETDTEAASLIRELREELRVARSSNPLFNSDAAELLYSAADSLRNLEDNAGLLSNAAGELRNLEDRAHILSEAADRLKGAESIVAMLNNTVDQIYWAAARLEDFREQ